MNDTSFQKRLLRDYDFKIDRISENESESGDNSTSLVPYKHSLNNSNSIKYKTSPLDFIDLKYVKHNSSFSNKLKPRALSQLGSEKSTKSSKLSDRSLNASVTSKNQYNSLNSTPHSLNDAFKNISKNPQLKVQYINIVENSNLIPKYLSGTIKFETLKKDNCNRNFEKKFEELPIKLKEKGQNLPIVRRSDSFIKRSANEKSLLNKDEKDLDKSILYYIEEIENQDNPKNPKFNPNNSLMDLRSSSSLQKFRNDDSDSDYHRLNKTFTNDQNDYNEKVPTQKNNYESLGPKLKTENSLVKYNFQIQRTTSSYETYKAIKKRVKFFEKIDYFDYVHHKEKNTRDTINIANLSLIESENQIERVERNNRHSCLDNDKKKKDKKRTKKIKSQEEANQLIVKDLNRMNSKTDSPLLESYKEIINKSIEKNKLKVDDTNKPVDDRGIKYKHLLDKLIDNEQELKRQREKSLLNSKLKKSHLDVLEEDVPIYYDSQLTTSENWLLKWSILKNVASKNLVEIFQKNDSSKKGYLNGEKLQNAIAMSCDMTNLRLSYLLSVLSLCGIEGANLKVFNIIISLALKVNHLDNEWFMDLLPQFDLSSVENKVFKALNLWKHLVNPKTKTLSIYELIIEFEAGCVSKDHIEYAKRKFADRLYFDITDYLTYIPLFLFIHDRIVKNPFLVTSQNNHI